MGIYVIIPLQIKTMITKCFGVAIYEPHTFDIISCIVTGIRLSNYYLFSILKHQTSYLKDTSDTLYRRKFWSELTKCY